MTDGTDDNGQGAYRVGYGKPPLHSRFRPGQSGNRRGRPRQKQAPAEAAAAVLDEKMNVTVNGKRKRVSVQTAILLRQRELALTKGDIRAAKFLLGLRGTADNGATPSAAILSEEDLAILRMAGLSPDEESSDAEDR